MQKIKVTLITSGQHTGWYCAEYNGMGLYGRTKEAAIRTLRMMLGYDD